MYGLLSLLQHWEKLVPHGPEKPKGRMGHAVSIIHSPLKGDQQTLLLMTGGSWSGSWLLSIGDGASWREVSDKKEEQCTHYTDSDHGLIWCLVLNIKLVICIFKYLQHKSIRIYSIKLIFCKTLRCEAN